MTEHESTELTGGEGGLNATPTKPRERRSPKLPPPRTLPLWKVILHNDDITEIDDVIKTIRQLTPLNKEEAAACTREAHETGAALILTTHQERAELYVEQFTSCKLTVTAEPGA